MKIVITSNYPFGNETGAAKVAEDLSNHLSKKNNVLLVLVGKKYKEYSINKNLQIIEVPSIDFGKFQLPTITPIVLYRVFKYLDSYDPDIVHGQNAILISRLVQMWTILNKKPFILTFHHIPTEVIYHLLPNLSKSTLTSLVQDIYKNISLKNILKNTSGIVAVNKAIHDSIRTVDKKIKIKIINNGVEVKELYKIKSKLPSKNKVNFVFLGSYNERKNQLFLVKVFKNLGEKYILNLYGSKQTGKEYVSIIEKYIKKNKVKNVFVNDFEKSIEKVFKQNDYLISASKKEAQSLVVIQSMAAGKPIIGIENETINELINKNNGLKLGKNLSSKQVSEKVKKFVDSNDYLKMSNKVRVDSERFDIEKVVSKIQKFYYSVSGSYSEDS